MANMGRPSISVKQSIDEDVLNIMKSSDKLTWETLDLMKKDIIKEIKIQNNKIDGISDQILSLEPPSVNNTYSNAHAPHPTNDSALIDSIKMDIIQEMSEKINIIDSKVDSIESKAIKIDIIENKVHAISNSVAEMNKNTITTNHTIVDRLNTFAFASSSNGLDHTEIINNSLLLNEIIDEGEHSLIVEDDDDIHSKTLTSQSLHELNNSMSDSISDKSVSLESIHDISCDNINGNTNTPHNAPSTNAKSRSATSPHFNTKSSSNITTKGLNNLNKVNSTKKYSHELYLSKLPVNLCETDIRNYIMAKGITNVEEMKITKLVKKDADLSSFSFISFKIDVNDSAYPKLIDKAFWPKQCLIKEFVQKPQDRAKNNSVAQIDNFLLAGQATKPAT